MIATGIAKLLRYKKETTWGVQASNVGGQALRRVTSNLDLKKATFGSKELRPDFQVADFRHGGRSVDGTISGELSVGTYGDFMGSICRQAWAAKATTGAITTVAAASTVGAQGTFTLSAGSFLAMGFDNGDVVTCTGWTTTGATNNNHNFYLTNVTALVMTGVFLDGVPMGTKIAGDSVTITQAGKKNYLATSGQVNDSYSIEHWFSDIQQSETFVGCRISSMDIKLPSNGFAMIDTAFMGKDMIPMITGGPYFTSPASISTGGNLAGVNGQLYVQGNQVGLITGMNIKINANMTSGEVIGSPTRPDVFMGAMDVSGQLTVYFIDNVMRDLFVNETEASVQVVFTSNNTATADFIAFTLPRIKLGGGSKDDGQKGLIMTMPYTALLNIYGGVNLATPYTTLAIQDSRVP
ncbi:phage tail tube protein [Solimicrobium silvestre]|uniref:Uncharacterized protein n=1 Tax=Solimicrobium silvestre TaxID=2099400 RepID=A0A2S9GY69_9BURK|nr:phage tail tube protein [Solimicrobium silvestre]PRC92675.1 hypothetical protein S2091_2730 [Solimicrobium silvestre]